MMQSCVGNAFLLLSGPPGILGNFAFSDNSRGSFREFCWNIFFVFFSRIFHSGDGLNYRFQLHQTYQQIELY